MKKTLPFFIALCLFSISLVAQTKNDIDKLVKEAEYYLRSTNDSIKGLRILSRAKENYKRIGNKRGILLCGEVLNFYYIERGNYGKVIENSNDIEPLAKELESYDVLSDLNRMRGLSYGYLGLYEQGYKEFQAALKYTKKLSNKNWLHYKAAFVYENMTSHFAQTNSLQNKDSTLYYLKKSLEEIKKIEDHNPDVSLDAKYNIIATTSANISRFYMYDHEPPNMEISKKYFLDALEIYNNKKYKIPATSKMLLTVHFGTFYYHQGNYDKAIKYSYEILAFEKKLYSPYDRKDAYQILGVSYLEKNDQALSKKYMELYINLNDSLNAAESASIEAPINKIISQEKEKHTTTILIIAGCFIIIMAFVFRLFWKRKNRILHKNYEILVQKLRTEKKTGSLAEETNDNSKSLTDKSFNIIEETVDTLLLKLEKFEKSKNIIKKDVSLTWLANHLNTNTRYLSEVIKKHKGKSFSNYINSLRINYIVELLYEEPKHREYKTSYLAELCGFSSREVFTTTFKKETGISPSYFLDNLKNEIDITDEQEKHRIV